MSGVAKSLTFGAQTGRGSNNGVTNRAHEPKYARLIEVVHQLAQSAEGAALPHLGLQILKLEQGQVLNQHRDYRKYEDYPNRTMKFGSYEANSTRHTGTQKHKQHLLAAHVDAKIWKNFPLHNIVDTSEQHIMKPKTLQFCCQCAKDFIHECDLSDGLDAGINLM